MAVATHVHFDHSGGLHQFDKVAIHEAEAAALEAGNQLEAVTWLSDSEIQPPPHPGWRAADYRVKEPQAGTEVRRLRDGDVIDTGGN